MKTARIYIRVSTDEQNLQRQENLVEEAKKEGYYVAGVYREKASGVQADRPELLRLINDLQEGDVVIAERMDRISRLPLREAEKLIASIHEKGAYLSIPGVVNFSSLKENAEGVTKIVLEAVQDMLLKLALQMARDDYEVRRKRVREGIERAQKEGKYRGRTANQELRKNIIQLRKLGYGIAATAKMAHCSESHVKKVWAIEKNRV